MAGFGSAAATPAYTAYDGFGRVAATADGDGRVRASYHDADGHLTLTVNGLGGTNPEVTAGD